MSVTIKMGNTPQPTCTIDLSSSSFNGNTLTAEFKYTLNAIAGESKWGYGVQIEYGTTSSLGSSIVVVPQATSQWSTKTGSITITKKNVTFSPQTFYFRLNTAVSGVGGCPGSTKSYNVSFVSKAVIDVGDYYIDEEHWASFTKPSNAYTCDLEIDVKMPNESDDKYFFVRKETNYQSGQRMTYTDTQLSIIYDEKLKPTTTSNTYVDTKYILTTYFNGQEIGKDIKVVKGKIRKGIITSVGNYTVEDEHWVNYKTYQSGLTYDLEVDIKKPSENDSAYWFATSRQNYKNNQHIKYTSKELKNNVYPKYQPSQIIVRNKKENCTYLVTRYILKTYKNGKLIGKHISKTVKGYIQYGVIIDKVTGSVVEGNHRISYTNFSSNTRFKLWIVAKPTKANDNQYVTVAERDNYTGSQFYFSANERFNIYNRVAPAIKMDSKVDIMYHFQIYSTTNGEYVRDWHPVTTEKITQAMARINSISNSTIEQEHIVKYTKYSNYFWYVLRISARKSGTNNNFENIGTLGAYQSGKTIKFSDENILKMYNMTALDTRVGALLDIKYRLETWDKKGGTFINADVWTIQKAIGGNIYVKNNGVWKSSVPFINIKGTWKPCLAYLNFKRVWKKGVVK